MTHPANNASAESFDLKPSVATRAAWSRAGNSRLSTRAESRLAPCMVRPISFPATSLLFSRISRVVFKSNQIALAG